MEQWTPYLLTFLAGVGTVVWFYLRRNGSKMDTMGEQLTRLDSVPGNIAQVSASVHSLEKLVSDELRHFDVRITRLEARSEARQEVRP